MANAPLPTDRPDPGELAALALDVAQAAGRLVLDGLARRRRVAATKSSATDVVTEVDRASERLIVERLRRARPDDAVLGEEDGGLPGRSGVRWLIDPIDGTVNYLYGHPGFAVSIAAELVPAGKPGDALQPGDAGQPGDADQRGHADQRGDAEPGREVVAGVVLDPLREEAFTAAIGGGARRNGQPIAVTAAEEPGQALVATGFSYRAVARRHQALALAHLLPRVRDIRRVGSAALDLCSVACGRVDAYYEAGLNPWDRAAGQLVAAEAGARVSDVAGDGPPGDLTGVLAAPPALHAALVPLLAEANRWAAAFGEP